MRQVWLTSDTHFGDENARKWRHRPFDTVGEMNEAMVSRWNEVVGKDDLVYHLGDVAVTDDDLRYVKRLNGEIRLLMGNHDLKRDRSILNDLFHIIEPDPFIITANDDWDEVNIRLCHYPIQRLFEVDGKECYTACGHVHNLWTVARKMVNVGTENWNFRPIPIEEVLNCRRCEMEGRWDANVYPDAPIDWQAEMSSINPRGDEEPTMGILWERVNSPTPREETDHYRSERAWMIMLGDIEWDVP